MGEKERILDHLDNDFTEPIRDPIWRQIYFSKPLLGIVEHPQFQKLDRIRQLGPAYLVYPGATHTRRSHSLGVLHIARRMLTRLMRKSREIGKSEMTLEGAKAFLCAALLHDVGHYPFAHSFKDLDVEAHEALAGRQILSDFAPAIKRHLRIEPEAVAAIVDKASDYNGHEDVGLYRKLLSGVLDPDKLDYLNRDAYFCGVPYGIQDVDFILEELYPDKERGVALSRKGVTALESILFSKYLMYKTVYWHKTVRIATAMIKKAIASALADGTIGRGELYGLDDEEFFANFTEARHPAFKLVAAVRMRRLHKMVYQVPFRAEVASHARLARIEERLQVEQLIARELAGRTGRAVSSAEVIVDVPEPISFEVDVPLVDTGERDPAVEGRETQVLGSGAAEHLPGSLRHISVSVSRDEDLMAAIHKLDIARFFA